MKPLVIANWKMNLTLSEALILTNGIKEGLADIPGVRAVLAVPFPFLVPVAEVLHRHRLKHLSLAAQNISWQSSGAYTGEVSAVMLQDIVDYVIIGHSERRRFFHETDEMISKKLKLALRANLKPILCVGEEARPSPEVLSEPTSIDRYLRPIWHQLEDGLTGLTLAELSQIIIAYEPIWAISTRSGAVTCPGVYAGAIAAGLKEKMKEKFGLL
jgi:triosephosphate isomerase